MQESTGHYEALSIIERVCSVLSLIGCVFIIITFCTSKSFHKPINRLVFYASFGNLMVNVGTLMARTYVGDESSAGCQLQAFLIQMFMPADAFWTLAMAVNVYLTFYYKFDSAKLRRMEIPYLLFCYGIPFIVALTFVFINETGENGRGRMYGNATLWCWIAVKWDIYRIIMFYGPVWVVMLITMFIYVRAGSEIYKKHKQLRDFSSHHEPEPLPPMDDMYSASKTTEVSIVSEAANPGINLHDLGRRGSEAPLAAPTAAPAAAYSVTISSAKRPNNRDSYGEAILPVQIVAPLPPLTANGNNKNSSRLKRRQAFEQNSATWSYTKCAILFFTAMLVTWIPSSANRVYSVVHPGEAAKELQYMSAFVLPLQGFWNAVIYIVTSWKACKMYFGEMSFMVRGPSSAGHRPRESGRRFRASDNFQMVTSPGRYRTEKSIESESMTELASRPNSHERR